MPSTAIFLTQDEYDGIMARLAALEAAIPARSSDIEALARRVQSVESTLSAFTKRMSELPIKGTVEEAVTKGATPA